MDHPPGATVTSTTRSLDQLVDIETPEQVVFSYTIAGVGSRAAAALIDTLVCVAALLALVLLVAFARTVVPDEVRLEARSAGAWAMAILVLAQFAIIWGYYVLWEGLADGQTPGKRRLGLRVVRDGGYSVSFAESAIRNLVRLLDMQPVFLYGIGIASVVGSRSGKRLGDLVAGTIVVREQLLQQAPAQLPGARAVEEGMAAAILNDDEYALLERFVARRQTLDAERRRTLAVQLVARLGGRVPEVDGGSPQGALLRLFERERAVRARGGAARSDTGAARERHAIVAEGAERWREFASRLYRAQRGGLRRMSEEEIGDFVARYRALSTDLARLSTAARGRELDELFYLSRLVAAGHNLLYRRREAALSSIWRFALAVVPREIRRSWRPILAAAAMLFLPAFISYGVVVAHPHTAEEFIPEMMIDRAEQGVERARHDEGYVADPQLLRPVMASRIIANNVQVTFAAFAFGATAGVGTLLLLVTNGIVLGGVAGLYASKGIGALLLAFVAPHGVLELTAIAIAGGAGLLVAKGIVFPGARARQRALVEEGQRAIRLMAASTGMLLVAGAIEGLISPRPYWPLEWKLFVAVVTGLLFLLYVTRGRP